MSVAISIRNEIVMRFRIARRLPRGFNPTAPEIAREMYKRVFLDNLIYVQI